MAARAIWKAIICWADFQLPVKLYSAVEDKTIHFHLLHDQDLTRLKQRMVNPGTDETVAYSETAKGYEIERNVFVLFDPDELEPLEPTPSREIEVRAFVDPGQINHQWYDRPYWLGPDGDTDEYFSLAEALNNRGVEGVVRWTMRKKRYVGALRCERGYLALITLRHAEEIISADDLKPPSGRQLDKQERDLAGQLIRALEGNFDPADYRDQYRERLMNLIETKRKGGTVEVEEYEEAPRQTSLAESLRASLQGVG